MGLSIVPHPRTLRKAREQVKYMVIAEASSQQIRRYLDRWVRWWVMTSTTWQYQALLQQFIEVCWDKKTAAYAAALSQLHFKTLRTEFETVVGVAA